MTKTLLLTSLTIAALNLLGQAAFAQAPPILPTDVTGPLAGGVGPAGLMNNLGAPGFYGNSYEPTWFERHFWRHHGFAFVSPSFLPYGYHTCGACAQSALFLPQPSYAVGVQPQFWY